MFQQFIKVYLITKIQNIQIFYTYIKLMDKEKSEIREMKQKLAKYEKLQKTWQKQKQILTKNIALMQEQISKHKAFNAKLLKKTSHKRTFSDEQTFIFNQTNISSYYPIVMVNKMYNWVPRANLRSHLDSVRALHWQGKYLISAGEDCLLKIWDRDKLRITVREHLAPVFTICGDSQSIFTAGAQGVVRQWSVSAFLESGRPVSEGQFHQDSIWQMAWNPHQRILITSSSDNILKLIQSRNNNMKQIHQINLNAQTPTSITLIQNNQKLVTGFVEPKKISIYDLQRTKMMQQIPYTSKQPNTQTNKVLHWSKQKLIITAHQDRTIRFFDPNSPKQVKNIVAHSDSVTSLCLRYCQPNQLISCSHDGTLRIWDLRKFKCINDIGIHMQKYDQSLLCISHSQQEQMVAVGGADGQIKILCPQN